MTTAQRSTLLKVSAIVLITVVIYFLPPPDGVDERGMQMLGIFVGTILGLIFQVLPTASDSLVGLAVAMMTGTMSVDDGEALAGFANSTVLLIVAAFFIADGFLVTGLGRRIALFFVSLLGKSPLGLSYGLALTDLVIAPATPSNTARAGGVVYPIVRSLSEVRGSTPESDESRKRLGSYLVMTMIMVNVVTSAMFITAMAGNPIAVDFAANDHGTDISWGQWALAAIVPGLVSLITVPWVMTKIYPPSITETPEAPAQARAELKETGTMTSGEWIMTGTFVMLLALWCLANTLELNSTAVAFLGIAVLLVTKTLTWKNLADNSSAWSTYIFFAVLVGMATHLSTLGVTSWVGDKVAGSVDSFGWMSAFIILTLVYWYVHYLFASNTAQITAMYTVFLGAAIATGAPALFAALVFGFIGNLFGGISHYASGPAGVAYGSGYVKTSEWFRIGFLMSIVLIAIWTIVGGLWMKVIGVW